MNITILQIEVKHVFTQIIFIGTLYIKDCQREGIHVSHLPRTSLCTNIYINNKSPWL